MSTFDPHVSGYKYRLGLGIYCIYLILFQWNKTFLIFRLPPLIVNLGLELQSQICLAHCGIQIIILISIRILKWPQEHLLHHITAEVNLKDFL
jgi:hypothetical protein